MPRVRYPRFGEVAKGMPKETGDHHVRRQATKSYTEATRDLSVIRIPPSPPRSLHCRETPLALRVADLHPSLMSLVQHAGADAASSASTCSTTVAKSVQI
jgi:hypothetical protein